MESVSLLGRLRFARNVEQTGRGELQARRQFVTLDARLQSRIVRSFGGVRNVQIAQQL